MNALLAALARRGRVMLVVGLVLGLAWPAGGRTLEPYLPEMVAGLLFFAALRVGPHHIGTALSALRDTALVVLSLQLLLPLVLAALLLGLGVASAPAALALVLVAAGAPLAGSPNLSILMGGDPGPALRLVILGTALLPLTVTPVFALTGALGEAGSVFWAAGRLLALIAAAALLAFALHRPLMRGPRAVEAVDGLSVVLLVVVVVGLMGASAEVLRSDPWQFLRWLTLACAVNFGLQMAAACVLRAPRFAPQRIPWSIVAGNRNVALFLVALPPETAASLMLFIGCYQIPMYLTPYAMVPVHIWLKSG